MLQKSDNIGTETDTSGIVLKLLLGGAALVIIITGLQVAGSVFLPVFAAVIIGATLGPLQSKMIRLGIPSGITTVLIAILVLLFTYALVALAAAPIAVWIERVPEIGPTIADKLSAFRRPLESLTSLQTALSGIMETDSNPKVQVETAPIVFVQNIMAMVTPALGQLLLFFVSLFFFLLGRASMKRKLVASMQERGARLKLLRIFSKTESQLGQYLLVITCINAGLGILTWAVMWALDMPTPMLWGLMAFILNFAPYIGSLVTMSLLLIAGLATFETVLLSIAPALCFLFLTTLEGQFITPAIVGNRLIISPFLVILALAFLLFIWGPFGAFLAVPALIIGKVVLEEMKKEQQIPLPA
jgi:predicted PurR-regulated permease PerM